MIRVRLPPSIPLTAVNTQDQGTKELTSDTLQPTTPNTLTKLPGEMRNDIYRLVLAKPTALANNLRTPPSPSDPRFGLLFTSRQIRAEALSLWRAEETFEMLTTMETPPHKHPWDLLHQCVPAGFNHIQHLKLDFELNRTTPFYTRYFGTIFPDLCKRVAIHIEGKRCVIEMQGFGATMDRAWNWQSLKWQGEQGKQDAEKEALIMVGLLEKVLQRALVVEVRESPLPRKMPLVRVCRMRFPS